ncbi:hypothetical protein SUGI_0389580 [Cryptomeria japonica]|uniref:serine/threonine protein phosphatase 2A 57 kDa regulatory subunit B' beta isoform n=1 Tax=Cryptomeria japonica TaxID=3369 RepID=UPI002408EBEB|nr:serine/threonine protein phosphatase 2A 57 kDa regulatory subunit B' beta isoform [Cryptomeria japonica]GLJ21238.1 hypothetical protein SUGI_0389580 [Cryptomeria japonica]
MQLGSLHIPNSESQTLGRTGAVIMVMERSDVSLSLNTGMGIQGSKSVHNARFTLNDLFKKDPLHMKENPMPCPKVDFILQKINNCKVIYDHSVMAKNVVEAREFKRKTLLDILECIKQGKTELSDEVLKELFEMFQVNIFRGLAPFNGDQIKKGVPIVAMEYDEDKTNYEPSWPHLQIIYEILLRLLLHTEPKSLSKESFLDKTFVMRLLDHFDSEDPREREILKTIFHRIYGKFTFLRSFMRKAVNNVFFQFIFETERHNGIGELLEIMGSIINGFVVPLKEEHKLFLTRVLIPLHKPKNMGNYHTQLQYCVSQFVQKDSKLADVVIKGLIKFWPVTNCQKESLLLGELEEVLEYTQEAGFSKCSVPLARLLARSLTSFHSQVAERALYMWNNERFVNLVSANMADMLPMVIAAIEKNVNDHWNLSIQDQTLCVKKMLESMDPELFKKCLHKFKEEESNSSHLRKNREHDWKRLEIMATSKPSSEALNGFGSPLMSIEVM